MKNFLQIFSRWLFTFRFFLLAVAVLITGFFAFYALQISFNFSPETIFIEDDPAYQAYENTYLSQFSHMGTPGVLAIKSEAGQENLVKALNKAQEILSANPYIKKIISPLNQPIVTITSEGLKTINPVNNEGTLKKEAISYFSSHPLYKNSFISRQQDAYALVFMMTLEEKNQELTEIAINSIKKDISKLKDDMPAVSFYVTGLPFIQNEMITILKSDQFRFVPLLTIFLIVFLLLTTKHPLGAIYPLLIIFFAMVWTLGFLALMGHEINMVNHAIIILIMVIGIADAVHIYTRFIDESIKERRKSTDPQKLKKTVTINTLYHMLLPCFLTSATTSLGFLASSAAGVTIIKQFGIDAAVSVIFCFLVTFLLIPALLSIHPIPKTHKAAFLGFWPQRLSIDNVLRFFVTKSLKYAKVLSFLAVVLTVAAIFLSQGIRSSQTWVGELRKDNEASIALDFIETNFGGVMPFYIVFSSNKDTLTSFDVFKEISTIANKLRHHAAQPTIKAPSDPIDYLLKQGQKTSLQEIDENTFNKIYTMMIQSDLMSSFFSKDKYHLVLQGFLPNMPTKEVEQFRQFVNETLSQHPIKNTSSQITGAAVISSRALHNITRDMTYSLMLAVVYILVFVAIFFRSLRYAAIAILPNILPIGLTIVFMRFFNIDIRLATVMIFSMALGLSIDTCVHLLSRVKEEALKLSDPYKKISVIRSIYRAFHGSGRPIIYTTVILLGGFSVMMLSRFLALRDFGFISAIVLLSAFFADIILLPALILVSRKRAPKRSF